MEKSRIAITTAAIIAALGNLTNLSAAVIAAAVTTSFAAGVLQAWDRAWAAGKAAGRAEAAEGQLLRIKALQKDAPLNAAGLVSHLYFIENAAFTFHALLKIGYFHEICPDIHKNPDGTLRTLALVMPHPLKRVKCTQPVKLAMEASITPPSFILLPSLPERAEEILKAGYEGGPKQPQSISGLQSQEVCFLRSSLATLSGHDDTFESIHDPRTNVRADIFLEESLIPCLTIPPYDTDGSLNACLNDFFEHGDAVALDRDNKIRRDIYNILKEFSLIFATIVTSIENFTSADANLARLRWCMSWMPKDSTTMTSGMVKLNISYRVRPSLLPRLTRKAAWACILF
ncbi:hypothetical protein BJ170DRAFT_716376 [Xylariales sp. AK1849]|nr:hypothetical protein BJ170DRAFT_716376 [Xylariales sp. AK1849]